tara:strand:+ start:1191 stop:1481 length:291 start_codon:yes stop_codon:yes gene_type:complete
MKNEYCPEKISLSQKRAENYMLDYYIKNKMRICEKRRKFKIDNYNLVKQREKAYYQENKLLIKQKKRDKYRHEGDIIARKRILEEKDNVNIVVSFD